MNQTRTDTGIAARSRDELMADAVEVLTNAARHAHDFPELLTHAVASAAANMGGIEELLADRPGSWEAAKVRDMLQSTVGHDEQYLYEYRTEPLVVRVHVDDTLHDLGYADLYYRDADEDLSRREDAIYAGNPAVLSQEQQAALAAIDQLRDRLDEQLNREWAAYGQAFAANVRRAATELLPGLTVPVEAVVEPIWQNHLGSGATFPSIEFDLWARARELTPLPGSGIPPNSYPLGADIAQVERDAGRLPLARLDVEGSEWR